MTRKGDPHCTRDNSSTISFPAVSSISWFYYGRHTSSCNLRDRLTSWDNELDDWITKPVDWSSRQSSDLITYTSLVSILLQDTNEIYTLYVDEITHNFYFTSVAESESPMGFGRYCTVFGVLWTWQWLRHMHACRRTTTFIVRPILWLALKRRKWALVLRCSNYQHWTH